MARHVFTTGSLSGLTTVHFARFMRVGPERHVLFTSYYDGSLESYNNDFVDQVAWVLNTVFGQQAGYPRTRWMIQDGAHNERWFKNFIRGHQVPTQVWWSAYPQLAAVTIDQNARLRAGLSGELDGEELLGMAAHPVTRRVETDDIQGLVLQGYGKLRAAAYVVLEITDAALARTWLRDLLPRISLGETRPESGAVNLAFTAAGLTRLGLSEDDHGRLLAGVPRGHDQRPPQSAARRRGTGRTDTSGRGEARGARGPCPAAPLRPRRAGSSPKTWRDTGRTSPDTGCVRWSASTRRTSAAASTSGSATGSRSRPCPASARQAPPCTRSRPASSCSATSTSTASTRDLPSCAPSDDPDGVLPATTARIGSVVGPARTRGRGSARLRPERQLPGAAHARPGRRRLLEVHGPGQPRTRRRQRRRGAHGAALPTWWAAGRVVLR